LFRVKYRIFASVSKDGVVTDLRVLKPVHFVTFPKVLEYPRLIGADLDAFDTAGLEGDPRIQQAAEDLKRSWANLKPALNRDIPSVAPKPGGDAAPSPYTGDRRITGTNHLGRAEEEIRRVLMNDELTINRKPLEKVLDALYACDQAHGFGTDEVIADKAAQLRVVLTPGKPLDVPRADGLVETMFRLIAQREREAQFRRTAS
jgi:hypothetical protein